MSDASIEHRLRLAIRIVLYSVLLALVVVVWHQRRAHGSEPTPAQPWRGVTDRGGTVELSTVDGRLVYAKVVLWYDCGPRLGARSFYTTFVPTWHNRRVDQRGRVVDAVLDPTEIDGPYRGTMATRLHVVIDEHPHGVVRGIAALRRPAVTCRSGVARFAVSRVPGAREAPRPSPPPSPPR